MNCFRLRDLRIESDSTQGQIAELLGITQQAYAHYENERRLPNVQNLCALADYYGVSVDYILGRTDEKNPAPSDGDGQVDKINSIVDSLSPESVQRVLEYAELLLLKQTQQDDSGSRE